MLPLADLNNLERGTKLRYIGQHGDHQVVLQDCCRVDGEGPQAEVKIDTIIANARRLEYRVVRGETIWVPIKDLYIST